MELGYVLRVLGRRMPVTDGVLRVDGVEGPVSIRRDRFGVPYVSAATDADVWFGLGFCHGQDRAFQLESLIRVIRGTLSELIGPEGLPIDRLSRRMGLRVRAEEQLAVLPAEIREMAEAYARGVDAGIRIGCERPAHEFVLLRAEPSTMEAADVVGMFKLMSFLLASNWDRELARYRVLTLDGPEALRSVDVTYPDWHPVSIPPHPAAGSVADRLAEDLAAFSAVVGEGGGSNAWAVSSDKTATGRPLLANDPHLAPTLPPHWYLAHLRTPDWAAAGASFVGVPAIPVGHNGFCAWGVTAGLVDNTDLFLEEIGPDGRSVRQGDGFVPCRVREEVIRVKGSDPVVETVLETPRGPIVGPALGAAAISMKATWLEPTGYVGLLGIHKARSWDEFRAMFDPWPGLPLNLVYADRDGHIGWQLVGDAPIRLKGAGALPIPGADAGWEDRRVPFEEMPHTVDPDEGYVASANNRPIPADEPPFLGVDWIEGYRYMRICEALAGRDDWTVDGFLRLQTDLVSIPWREMRPHVLATAGDDPDTRTGLAILEAWDGVVSPHGPGPCVYELFVAELIGDLVRELAPRSAEWALGKGFNPLVPDTAYALVRTGWLVDLLRAGRVEESRVAAAVARAVRQARDRLGPDPSGWNWGDLRPLRLGHPLGRRRPLDKVFDLGPIRWGGDATTVSQAAVVHHSIDTPPPFIASLRTVIDVGNWSASRFVLPGGQSGNPASPHYRDQLDLWATGGGIPIAWEEDEIEARTVRTLRLVPRSPTG
jgi:penicillin amidase